MNKNKTIEQSTAATTVTAMKVQHITTIEQQIHNISNQIESMELKLTAHVFCVVLHPYHLTMPYSRSSSPLFPPVHFLPHSTIAMIQFQWNLHWFSVCVWWYGLCMLEKCYVISTLTWQTVDCYNSLCIHPTRISSLYREYIYIVCSIYFLHA